MTKFILLMFSALLLFYSCTKDNSYPRIEETTNGKKWTLQIGSSPVEVYGQLQQLATEKNFNAVAVVYRKPYAQPEEIQSFFSLYNAITLQNSTGVVDRVLIEFRQGKVSNIEKGSAMLSPVTSWPQSVSDDIAIHVNDPVDVIYNKLLAIYELPSSTSYQIVLPDKPLDLSFDPDMANYEEWAFDFSEEIGVEEVGRSFVRLYFDNNKLVKIRHEYDVNKIYID